MGLVAALFVEETGIYSRIPGVIPWGISLDARNYNGPWPIVGHPPCGPWGAYSRPTPESTARGPLRGDDGGMFASALASARKWGGVIEHPRNSYAWAAFGLSKPLPGGRWTPTGNGWTCEVEQGHYGHAAQKPTWLYWCGSTDKPPPDLIWGPSNVEPRSWSKRRGVLECLSKRQRSATPESFALLLVALAELAAEVVTE